MDFLVLLDTGLVERGEMRKNKPRREREGSGAVVTKKEEKEGRGFVKLQKHPSLFYSLPKLLDTWHR